jgi:hypothetical protein
VEEVVVILLLTMRLLEGEVNAATTMVVVMVATTVAERVQAESFMIVRIVWGGKGSIEDYCQQ